MGDKDIRLRIRNRLKALSGMEDQQDMTSIWQTVYGDMITNLMLFFLMMFALNMVGEDLFSQSASSFKNALAGKKDEKAAPKPTAPPAAAQAGSLNDFFQKFAEKQKDVQMIEQGEGVRLRLPEPVLFDRGKAELKPEAARLLSEFANGLRNLPHTIVIEGHTDDVPVGRGPYKSNWELSEARAESVLNYLVYEEKIPAQRLAVAGFGEHWPFVPNDSDLNRALNRRIELLVITDGMEK